MEFYGLQDFHSGFEPPTSKLGTADAWVPNHLRKHLIVAVNLHILIYFADYSMVHNEEPIFL